ncbi:hypothetical protein ACJX0J_040750, partial [Zea mays]
VEINIAFFFFFFPYRFWICHAKNCFSYSISLIWPQIPLGVGEKPKRGFGSAMLKNLMFAVEKVKVAREIEVEGAYLKIYRLILMVAVICQIMASTPNVSQDHNKGNMKVSQS